VSPSLRRGARLAGLVVLVYALLRLPAAAGTPSGTLAFLQFNLCGSACGTQFAVVRDLEREITRDGLQPFVVTLNEICRGQYDKLLTDLPYRGHFEPTVPDRCFDGSDYGVAVLMRTPSVQYLGSSALPAPAGGEPRTVTCIRTEVQVRPLVACATHLDTDPRNTASQVATVAAFTQRFTAGAAVVVGGDFNAPPEAPGMHRMYADFTEVDPSDADTGGCARAHCGARSGYAHPTRKIDYLFLSRGAVRDVRSRVGIAPHSDHAPLRATGALTGQA
jgi:endonuclease/exonuclease/phosphatase family metal-dependent hydrolase